MLLCPPALRLCIQNEVFGKSYFHEIERDFKIPLRWKGSKRLRPSEDVPRLTISEDYSLPPKDYYLPHMWSTCYVRESIAFTLEEFRNQEDRFIHKVTGLQLSLCEEMARIVIQAYARMYFKTHKVFLDTILTLYAGQRDEACKDTFGKLPVELLQWIALEAEKRTILDIVNMEPVNGAPLIVSLLGIEKMFYSIYNGSIRNIPYEEDMIAFQVTAEISVPENMQGHEAML